MWICKHCGEKLEEQFESCWRCSTPREPGQPSAAANPTADPACRRLAYRVFRGTFATWDELFTKAAYFATELGRERLLNISHSVDDGDGVVTVWYWTSEPEVTPPA